MKKLTTALIICAFITVALIYSAQYDAIFSNTQVYFENASASIFTTESGEFTNTLGETNTLVISENAFSHFVISTNGGTLYKNIEFTITLKAVDMFGNHVSYPSGTNITLTNLDSSSNATAENLSIGAYTFTSSTTPDFSGVEITNQSFAGYGNIYIFTVGNTNQSGVLGTIEIRNAAEGVLTFNKTGYMGYSANALISLTDPDKNISDTTVETANIVIYSDTDATERTITLTETGIATGVFTNTFGFDTAYSASPVKLAAVDSDAIYGKYTDTIPTTATITTNSYFRLIQYIVAAANQYFIGATEQTNITVYGVDGSGNSNDISSQCVFSIDSAYTPYITSVSTNRVAGVLPGLGEVVITLASDTSITTNTAVLVTISSSIAQTISKGNLSVDVDAGTYNYDIYFDVRHTDDHADTFAVTDNTSEVGDAITNEGDSNAVITSTTYMISSVETDLSAYPSALNSDITLTFTYSDAELVQSGVAISEEDLVVVKLSNTGSGYVWTEVATSVVNSTANTVTANVSEDGVYALRGPSTKVSDLVTRAGIYPNPTDFRVSQYMYIINMPEDVEYVKIHSADAREKAEFTPNGGGIKFITIDGKSFYGIEWDGYDKGGNMVRSGLYYLEIKTSTTSIIKKFVIKK